MCLGGSHIGDGRDAVNLVLLCTVYYLYNPRDDHHEKYLGNLLSTVLA